MQFNSTIYLLLLSVVVALYWRMRPRRRVYLLLVASYVFYGYWDYRFLALILLSSTVDYVAARGIGANRRYARRWLLVSLTANLGALGFFKYYNFFAGSLRPLLEMIGLGTLLPALAIVLPVGISFYTFQTLAYTIDVYRGDIEPTDDFIAFLVYVSFFPQLVAGPIERAGRLLPQIGSSGLRPRYSSGLRLILLGLFKKVVIADTAATLVNRVYPSPQEYSGIVLLLATYAFALQIYCDFAGYTDIARGSARLLGIELMENFRQPYLSANIIEFWRRWHISLSTWLRDYLYIPLGGNRRGRVRTYVNLLLVMLLGGLWHGASWNFVIWGGLHGALLAVQRAAGSSPFGPGRRGSRVPYVLLNFHLVCLGWVFFRAATLPQAFAVLSRIFTLAPGDTPIQVVVLPVLLVVVLLHDLIRDNRAVLRWFHALSPMTRGAVYACLALATVLCWDRAPIPFVYFQF